MSRLMIQMSLDEQYGSKQGEVYLNIVNTWSALVLARVPSVVVSIQRSDPPYGLGAVLLITVLVVVRPPSLGPGTCIVGNRLLQGIAPWPPALQQPGFPQLIQRLFRLTAHCQGCFP